MLVRVQIHLPMFFESLIFDVRVLGGEWDGLQNRHIIAGSSPFPVSNFGSILARKGLAGRPSGGKQTLATYP